MSEDRDITFRDVETAIKILERYLQLARRAERILSLLSTYNKRYSSLEEMIAQSLINQYMYATKGRGEEVEEEEELDDEETRKALERLREIAEKEKQKKS